MLLQQFCPVTFITSCYTADKDTFEKVLYFLYEELKVLVSRLLKQIHVTVDPTTKGKVAPLILVSVSMNHSCLYFYWWRPPWRVSKYRKGTPYLAVWITSDPFCHRMSSLSQADFRCQHGDTICGTCQSGISAFSRQTDITTACLLCRDPWVPEGGHRGAHPAAGQLPGHPRLHSAPALLSAKSRPHPTAGLETGHQEGATRHRW